MNIALYFVFGFFVIIGLMLWIAFGWMNCIMIRYMAWEYPFNQNEPPEVDLVKNHLAWFFLGPIITIPLFIFGWFSVIFSDDPKGTKKQAEIERARKEFLDRRAAEKAAEDKAKLDAMVEKIHSA